MSTPSDTLGELFELEMIGGAIERRYRKLRPEAEAMPWGSMNVRDLPAEAVIAARRSWTGAAFQEHRTGIACAATLRAMMECRAPLDLIAFASRFPLDEMVHVELCARMAMELGGGTEIRHDSNFLVYDAASSLSAVARAAELVVRFFCVGEALSIPLLKGTWHAATHPLPRAILGRIVRDEAAHGVFGFTFLDWALPHLSPTDIAHLGRVADEAIAGIRLQWRDIERRTQPEIAGDGLGWMGTDAYLSLAARSLNIQVMAPLLARGIPLDGAASG
ncbi:MAG TPA: hypothetical protein VGG33_15845 [Polyangia bacterium]